MIFGKNKKGSSQGTWSEGRLYEVIRMPLLTEKTTLMSEANKAVFEVAMDSSKPEIKAAIEKIYNVKVKAVNVMRVKGKEKRFRGHRGQRSDMKKAIITLEAGQTLDIVKEA